MNKYQEALDYVKCHPVCGEEDEIEDCEICEIKNNCIMNNNIKLIQELVDKETPKKTKTKMNEHNHIDRHCPICDGFVYSFDKYCGKCGQRIRSDE